MGPPAETDFREATRAAAAVRAQALALRRQAHALMRDVRGTHAALTRTVDGAHRILGTVRLARAERAATPVPGPRTAPQSALLLALAAAGLDAEQDLDELADDLIAAYRDAVAQDDERLAALLGGALREIGRHLAARVGPRAAGALSS